MPPPPVAAGLVPHPHRCAAVSALIGNYPVVCRLSTALYNFNEFLQLFFCKTLKPYTGFKTNPIVVFRRWCRNNQRNIIYVNNFFSNLNQWRLCFFSFHLFYLFFLQQINILQLPKNLSRVIYCLLC